MADPVEGTTAAAGKAGSFLTRKVGPLPLGIWLVAAVGIYYYYSRKSASSATTAAGSGQQTDPAGNVGTIDPATGYVAGSSQDAAALQSQSGGSSTGGGSSNNPAVGNGYSDNNAWGRAAINYLVGLGVDPTTANQAVQLYLSSQPLTTAQQADVNESIQALGPPPDLPGPTTNNPTPVTNPPGTGTGGGTSSGGTGTGGTSSGGGTTTKTVPVPTNFVVSDKSNHSVRLTWKRVNGATGYHLAIAPLGSSKRTDQDVGPDASTAVFSGLTGGGKYSIDLWARPGPANGPHAQTSVTLPK